MTKPSFASQSREQFRRRVLQKAPRKKTLREEAFAFLCIEILAQQLFGVGNLHAANKYAERFVKLIELRHRGRNANIRVARIVAIRPGGAGACQNNACFLRQRDNAGGRVFRGVE